jgi:hypothetical protein
LSAQKIMTNTARNSVVIRRINYTNFGFYVAEA